MSDLIDRQAAIDAIAEMMPTSYTPDGSHPADEGIFMAQEIFADCITVIEILPSAQPEQKKGKWIKTDSQQYFRKHYPTFTCSECGQRKDGKRWNYCPNCGADMRGESDD